MTATCRIHNLEMKYIPSGVSKKTGKRYNAFFGCPNYNCKETAPATDDISMEETKEFERELEEGDYTAQQKNEAQQKLNKIENEDQEDEYRPLKRREWNEKEFTMGMGVYSKEARGQMGGPKDAVETGHFWEWMDFAYMDWEGYEEWKEKKRKNYKRIYADNS